jgi:predicted  nucleic acid-binding Zn-ribbon protein
MTEKTKEISIEQKLKALYDLQCIMSQIDKIKILRGELPREVQDLEDEIIGLQTRIQNFNNDCETLTLEIKKLNEAIKVSQENIARYKEQMDNVRNNLEYEHLSREVNFEDLNIKSYEKKIREFEGSIKHKLDEQDKANALLAEKGKDLDDKKAELESIIVSTKKEEEELREQAKSLETLIEPRLLAAFKRIRKNAMNGLGVVYIQRDACGGCFNKIPAQRQLDIRLRKKIIVCEHCGRIIIDPELAGVVVEEAPAAPAKRR